MVRGGKIEASTGGEQGSPARREPSGDGAGPCPRPERSRAASRSAGRNAEPERLEPFGRPLRTGRSPRQSGRPRSEKPLQADASGERTFSGPLTAGIRPGGDLPLSCRFGLVALQSDRPIYEDLIALRFRLRLVLRPDVADRGFAAQLGG